MTRIIAIITIVASLSQIGVSSNFLDNFFNRYRYDEDEEKTLEDYIENHPNWFLFDHEKCGINVESDRIIGGNNATLGQYPWLVRLGYQSKSKGKAEFKCGGSLINKMYVLTAAHCVAELAADKSLEIVRIGEFLASSKIDCVENECAPAFQDIEPEDIIVHENYNTVPFKNDIALIRLKKPATFHKYVRPICLPHGDLMGKNMVGTKMEVAGWGVADIKNFVMSPHLLTVKVPILEIDICKMVYTSVSIVDSFQMCAGGIIDKDSCQGDSGGPLMKVDQAYSNSSPQFYVFGTVSYGSPKCGKDVPAVYTNIRRYLGWILDNIRP